MFKIIAMIAAGGLVGCGSSSNGGDSTAPTKITVNSTASQYIEDGDANDNLTIVSTDCSLINAQPKATLYYTSALLGVGAFVQSEVSLPFSEKWNDGKYTQADSSTNCNAPGYRAIAATDIASAKSSTLSGMKFIYACGGTCEYTLKSKELNSNGYYKSFSVTWTCTGVQVNPLSSQGNFGAAIDKVTGSATCQ